MCSKRRMRGNYKKTYSVKKKKGGEEPNNKRPRDTIKPRGVKRGGQESKMSARRSISRKILDDWVEKECVDARNDHQTEGAAKANIFSFKMACSICDNVPPLDSLLPSQGSCR